MIELDQETGKRARIAQLAAVGADQAATLSADPDRAGEFLSHYFRHVEAEDLLDRSDAELLGLVVQHYRLAAQRPPGVPAIAVHTPTEGADGFSCAGATVCQIITDDLPFLVDSVTTEVVRQGWTIRDVFHPQYAVRRDITGALLDIVSMADFMDAAESDPTVLRESWMHLELLPPADPRPDAETRLADGLRRVLRDVSDSVADWEKMRAMAADAAAVSGDPQVRELLDWLLDDHFTFLGYREYVLRDRDGELRYDPVPGTGLGVLRADVDPKGAFSGVPLPGDRAPLMITKGNRRSTVHRPANLDYIAVRVFDEQGEIVGERRFIGLYVSLAYAESVSRIPVLKQKAEAVLRRSGYDLDSHGGRAIMDVLDTYPRDELFQASVDELAPVVERIAQLKERRQVRAFVRREAYGRYLSCLVFLPRDRYTTEVRLRMEQVLLRVLGGERVDHTARVSESVLARLHFVVRARVGEQMAEPDVAELEAALTAASRSWDDDFTDELAQVLPGARGDRLDPRADRLVRAARRLPEGYKADFTARQAVLDLTALQQVTDRLGLVVYTPERPDDEADLRLKVFRHGSSLKLSTVLPHLSLLGVDVIDERPYDLAPADDPDDHIGHDDHRRDWIYDFGLRIPGGRASRSHWDDAARTRFTEAFEASYSGRSEADQLNQLVMAAGLHWHQVAVLRTVSRYLQQVGTIWSQAYIASALRANVDLARLLVRLFETRFDPDLDPAVTGSADRDDAAAKLRQQILGALDDVASLDHDRIIRSSLHVIDATVRTNAYLAAPGSMPTLAIKMLPRQLVELPEPKPAFEIFVYSPRLEGVHLRFGPVARGGLRWSDRAEDFRTEILGLVKAQMVKNTVIVPVGAKGGFYCKQLPDPHTDREGWFAEGVSCYKLFVASLLSITDNILAHPERGGEVVPPERVVRYDADDPYLVVAADKGTATFSDLANSIAVENGFWLGDAFASGGSVGYDHKKMGITARGAWQSVIRHFRELGVDCQTTDFTCVGIGDMSGDVFGNGLLLSRHTRLVAAFDHRHVFVDPAPDAERSWGERKRLFDLQRSSWADYDRTLISAGGGVFDRNLKSIMITDPMRAALGLADDVTTLTPVQLITAILTAPVDLVWNGGIGTYVKGTGETHTQVGDKANDQLRVNGGQLRARCVGEGGNLGLTQLGRIEYAARGGKINTDFIDNSAGVDTSDYEVNIKILLAGEVAAGRMTMPERDALLASMTDEVAELVLAHNVNQNTALANAVAEDLAMARVHEDWMQVLSEKGYLDRRVESMPSTDEMEARVESGRGLTSPELCTLLAWTKIFMADAVLASDLPDDPYLANRLTDYFPTALRERQAARMPEHRLHREIITTVAINRFVDSSGISCFHRLSGETGAEPADVIRAQLVARALFATGVLETRIQRLDHAIDAEVQTRLRLAVRTLVERATRWILNTKRTGVDIIHTVDQMGEGVALVQRELPNLLGGRELSAFHQQLQDHTMAGVPEDLARRIAGLPAAYTAMTIVQTVLRDSLDIVTVSRTHFVLGQLLGLDRLLARISELSRADRWQTQARATLRDDLYSAHAQLTAEVLTGGDQSSRTQRTADEAVAAWRERTPGVAKAEQTLQAICLDAPDLARMSVGLGVVRSLLSG